MIDEEKDGSTQMGVAKGTRETDIERKIMNDLQLNVFGGCHCGFNQEKMDALRTLVVELRESIQKRNIVPCWVWAKILLDDQKLKLTEDQTKFVKYAFEAEMAPEEWQYWEDVKNPKKAFDKCLGFLCENKEKYNKRMC